MTDDLPFRSARPDGKPGGAPYAPPGQLATQDTAALKAHLRTVEEDLYWSRHEPGRADRAIWEVEWNQIKSEFARRSPQAKPWVYKHDRRDEFVLSQQTTPSGATRTTVSGTVHDPDSTIKWRSDTACGRHRYKQIQADSVASGRLNPKAGDDLGHLAADRYGIDPEGVNKGGVTHATRKAPIDRPNYTAQNARMNEGTAWKRSENWVCRHSRQQPVGIEIDSTVTPGRGPHREQSRTLTAYQDTPAGRRVLSDRTLTYGNFDDRVTAVRRIPNQNAGKTMSPPSSAEVRSQMDSRDAALMRHLDIERKRLVFDRQIALARTRLDRMEGDPAQASKLTDLEAKLQKAEARRERYKPDGPRAKAAARGLDRREAKLQADIRAPGRPAREQAMLRRTAREREVGVHLSSTEAKDTPRTRAGMRTMLRFHGEQTAPVLRGAEVEAKLSKSRAASEVFRSARNSDLSKPVSIQQTKPGEKLVRYADPARDPANGYGRFYTKPGTGPGGIGVATTDTQKPQQQVVVDRTRTLVSTASPTVDNWTQKTRAGKSAGHMTGGGGTQRQMSRTQAQTTAPRRQDLLPAKATPPAKAQPAKPADSVAAAKARLQAASGPKAPSPAVKPADPVAAAKARLQAASGPKAPAPAVKPAKKK